MSVISRLSRQTALRAGYGTVIGVLVLTAGEAYRIQTTVSQQHLETYRRYVDEDKGLTKLRQNLWLAGNDVRDFFINTTPEQADLLRTQLKELEEDSNQTLDDLDEILTRRDTVPMLRRSLADMWAVMRPIPNSQLSTSDPEQYAFLESEIVPRRGELYNVLMNLVSVGQQELQDSQRAFDESRRRATQRLLMMLVVSVVLCLFVARASVRHLDALQREADRHFSAIEQAKKELQQLSARLLEVEEESRRSLSRELHDEIGQTLALLQIEISHAMAIPANQRATLCTRLERAHELAERTVQTIRNISGMLRPALLDDLGLVPALQFQLEDFVRRTDITCDFVESGVPEDLPDGIKTCAYRVLQEALHNCEKHAGATNVQVTVRCERDVLIAELRDNGGGFSMGERGAPARSTGLGLLGMRERAAAVGGSLSVRSSPGQGTVVTLRIPIAVTPTSKMKETSEVTA